MRQKPLFIEELGPTELKVLTVLWEDREKFQRPERIPALPLGKRQVQARRRVPGLTAEQLKVLLGYKTVDSVYEALNALIVRGQRRVAGKKWVTIVGFKRRAGRGRPPVLYTIADYEMADWPATAFFLLELCYFNKGGKSVVGAKEFQDHLIKNCQFTPESIDSTLEYACRKGYANKDPLLQHAYRTLAHAERTRSEMEFLELIEPYYHLELARIGKKVTFSYYDQQLERPRLPQRKT